MESRENHPQAVLMNVGAMLIFGTIGVVRRYIPVSSAFLAFSRGILGGLFLLIFMRIRRKRAGGRLPARTAAWLAAAGAAMGVNWILLFEAYRYTTVAVATLCYYMQPTIVTLLSPLLFGEKLTRRKAACAAVAVLGMVLVSGVTGQGSIGAGSVKGILLGLGAAVFYSAVVIMNKRVRVADAYRKTAVQLFSAGGAMIPYLLITGGFTPEGIDAGAVPLLLIVGLVHTGAAYVLYFGSLEGLRAQSAAILSYIDPVASLFLSAVFLREPLRVSGMIGAVLIIGSAILWEIRTERNSPFRPRTGG